MTLEHIQKISVDHRIAINSQVIEILQKGAAIGIGVSGGKDSDAMAIVLKRFLDAIDHRGPRVLIHADLGDIEHADSLPQCQRLADLVGMELVVVRRPQGGMIERWEQRWRDNAARYCALRCVTLITPFSSAAMRFCTSEMKIGPITRELAKRFHGLPIINAVGIRAEESTTRANQPVWKPNGKLKRSGGLGGIDWHPIQFWTVVEVFAEHDRAGLAPHYGYIVNGNTRISCAECVLATLHELQASLKDPRNHPGYRRIVTLEIASGFSFQPSRWLGDVRPDLLTDEMRDGLENAKLRALRRREIEARIPRELRYVKGWPTFVPSYKQAALLVDVRREIKALTGLPVEFIAARDVQRRYQELINQRGERR